MQDSIIIKGARVHNLKNIDVEIPRNTMTVVTGISGSGKSSLAFDTIYAEGHRRFVQSLSSYARMFLGQMDKPDVDQIDGLSPAISIDQKTTSKNPRSTVGTVTEIYDYMRLLWARVGTPHCPKCGKEIRQQTVDQIIDRIMALPEGTRIQVMAPVVRGRKGEHAKVFADARRSGYVRVRVDGQMYELDEDITLAKNVKWSDGKPVTINDVLFTMYTLSDPTYDGSSSFYAVPIEGMEEYRNSMMSKTDYILSLGELKNMARVTVNGTAFPILWKAPFECDITEALAKGNNRIEVEVTNLPANRIADYDRQGKVWRIFKDANIATFSSQNRTYNHWTLMPSGLNSEVKLIPVKEVF